MPEMGRQPERRSTLRFDFQQPKPILIAIEPTSAPRELAHLGDENIRGAGLSLGRVPHDVQETRVDRARQPARVGKIDAEYVVVRTHSSGSTDFRVSHGLGRIPRGFTLIHSKEQASIWRGTGNWTATDIWLQSDATDAVITVELR